MQNGHGKKKVGGGRRRTGGSMPCRGEGRSGTGTSVTLAYTTLFSVGGRSQRSEGALDARGRSTFPVP